MKWCPSLLDRHWQYGMSNLLETSSETHDQQCESNSRRFNLILNIMPNPQGHIPRHKNRDE